jgi:hypothetical protein
MLLLARRKMSEINNKTVPPKFRFCKKIQLTNRLFSWKLAALNTAAFCLIAGVDTYNLQHVEPPYKCPWGYWILLWSIMLVPGNYLLSRTKRWIIQVWSPCLFTIGIGCFVSIINFRAPTENLNFLQILGFTLFSLLGFVTSVIRYYIPHASEKTNLSDINVDARISWIAASINMWITLAITILTAVLAFIVFWLKSTWAWADSAFVGDPQGIAKGLIAIEAAGIALYVFFGPIYECFRKADHIRNMLLDIKK